MSAFARPLAVRLAVAGLLVTSGRAVAQPAVIFSPTTTFAGGAQEVLVTNVTGSFGGAPSVFNGNTANSGYTGFEYGAGGLIPNSGLFVSGSNTINLSPRTVAAPTTGDNPGVPANFTSAATSSFSLPFIRPVSNFTATSAAPPNNDPGREPGTTPGSNPFGTRDPIFIDTGSGFVQVGTGTLATQSQVNAALANVFAVNANQFFADLETASGGTPIPAQDRGTFNFSINSALDTISLNYVAPVPEPGFLLAAAALAGVAARRLRRV